MKWLQQLAWVITDSALIFTLMEWKWKRFISVSFGNWVKVFEFELQCCQSFWFSKDKWGKSSTRNNTLEEWKRIIMPVLLFIATEKLFAQTWPRAFVSSQLQSYTPALPFLRNTCKCINITVLPKNIGVRRGKNLKVTRILS